MARLNSCNVLKLEKASKHLWQFSPAGKFNLVREEVKSLGEPLPTKFVGKDWQTLFQPRLNVACLPADKVFLRALQLPKADFAETQSMVELQLEKLSPLPVAQIVWSFELLPHAGGDLQTAVVIVVARQYVEEFLGELEGHGYLADRLELPLIDQLQATDIKEDGVWIYPADPGGPLTPVVSPKGGEGAKPRVEQSGPCLITWWYGGVLHNLSLVSLPAGDQRGPILQNQLVQIMWAGELEGWITSPPKFHIVGDEQTADAWRNYVPSGFPVEAVPPPAMTDVVSRTARRAASDQPRTALLPPEYVTRYKQRFVDRLWMRGLGAMLMLYIFGVLIYFALAQFTAFQLGGIEDEAAGLGPAYTNTLRIKERVKVLQDQMDLQFAGLDCYKAIAETMPPELTLDNLNFDRGRKLTVSGTGASENYVHDFNAALRRANVNNQPLFSKVNPPNINRRPGGQEVSWLFALELRRTDTE